MKGTRHSEEQIIAILKQGEAGLATAEPWDGEILKSYLAQHTGGAWVHLWATM